MKRVFIVGCPRSGTTLLQTILAGHESVVSFSESHFFDKCFRSGSRGAITECLDASQRFREFLRENGMGTAEDRGRHAREMAELCEPFAKARYFVETLDKHAAEKDALAWVEKTPDHVLRIDLIDKAAPGARFIHVIRPPADVLVSLRDATRRWGKQRSWLRCWMHWYVASRETQRRRGAPRHRVLPLENLARDPDRESRSVCDWIGLPPDDGLLDRRRGAAREVILEEESWKRESAETIRSVERKPLAVVPAYLRPIVYLSQIRVYDQLLGHCHAA